MLFQYDGDLSGKDKEHVFLYRIFRNMSLTMIGKQDNVEYEAARNFWKTTILTGFNVISCVMDSTLLAKK